MNHTITAEDEYPPDHGSGGGGGGGGAHLHTATAEYLASADLQPLPRPERSLAGALRTLALPPKEVEWYELFEALDVVRAVAVHHPAALRGGSGGGSSGGGGGGSGEGLHEVTLAVLRQVDNLRSAIAKNALMTVGDMCAGVRGGMDPELGGVVPALLKRAADTNGFLTESAEAALAALTAHATPSRLLNALFHAAASKLPTVRGRAARAVEGCCAAVGSARLGQFREMPRLLTVVSRFMDEAQPETRAAGRRTMLRLVREGVVGEHQLQRALSAGDFAKVRKLLERDEVGTSAAAGFVVTNTHANFHSGSSRFASDPGVRR